MTGAYRDELAAAHAEIERLREENAKLNKNAKPNAVRAPEPRAPGGDWRPNVATTLGAIVFVLTLPLLLIFGLALVRFTKPATQQVFVATRNAEIILSVLGTALELLLNGTAFIAIVVIGVAALVGALLLLFGLIDSIDARTHSGWSQDIDARHPFVRLPTPDKETKP